MLRDYSLCAQYLSYSSLQSTFVRAEQYARSLHTGLHLCNTQVGGRGDLEGNSSANSYKMKP